MKLDREQYCAGILSRLVSPKEWPDFERHEFLTELKDIADGSFDQATTSGYLGALLIYHQLLQEMIALLLLDAEFYLQISVFPEQIAFPIKKKAMFGELVSQLEQTLHFESKDEFLANCQDLNLIRIDLVHRLTKKGYVKSIENMARKAKTIFEEGFEHFEKAHWWFNLKFKKYRKDSAWHKKARKLIKESA